MIRIRGHRQVNRQGDRGQRPRRPILGFHLARLRAVARSFVPDPHRGRGPPSDVADLPGPTQIDNKCDRAGRSSPPIRTRRAGELAMDSFRASMLAMQVDQAALMIGLIRDRSALRKIAPNGLYGFRVRRTLADPAVWYEANAFMGLAMIASGLAVGRMSLVLYLHVGPRRPGVRLGRRSSHARVRRRRDCEVGPIAPPTCRVAAGPIRDSAVSLLARQVQAGPGGSSGLDDLDVTVNSTPWDRK